MNNENKLNTILNAFKLCKLPKLELRLCLGGGSGMRVEDAGEIERLVVAASLVLKEKKKIFFV
jgi:hypothetical protein